MRTRRYLLALLAMASAGVTKAQADDPLNYAAMSDDEFRAVVRDNQSKFFADSCNIGVPILSEIQRRTGDEGLDAPLLFARSLCADMRGEYRAAAGLLDEHEDRFGATGLDNYGFYLASRLEDPDMALDRLTRLTEKGDEERLSNVDTTQFFAATRLIMREGRTAELEALALRLFENRRFTHFNVDIQPALARWALKRAANDNQLARVSELLGLIRDPYSYIEMLAQRAYQPVWPQIEERVGPNLTKVADENAEWALARLSNAPDDRDRFRDAAYALHYAGRFEDAIELARGWREKEGAFDTIEEGDAWAINIEAYALDSLGRRDEADARFDQLAGLPADDYPWVVNFVINRASRLVGQKRYDEALEAAMLAREVAETHGTTYAKMIIAHDFTCALEGLGRGDETGPEIVFLLEHRQEAIGSAAEALMCLGRDDEAAELVLGALADETTRSRAVDALQRPRFDLFYTASLLPQASDMLDSHEAVRREFERWARDIPEEFVPRAALRREELRR